MKNLKSLIVPAVFVALIVTSCGKQTNSNKMVQQKTQYFNTLEEASKKAKTDLQEILKLEKDIKLNIDLKELEQSNPQGSVKHYLVDINKFISNEKLKDLKEVSTDEGVSIVPFVYQNKVIATASVNKDQNGWSVGGLFNNKITSDLNKVKQILKEVPKFEINYFEAPNIDAHVYQAVVDTNVQYFTDYKNIFSIDRSANMQELVDVLRKDAIVFQKTYGDELRRKKLVK